MKGVQFNEVKTYKLFTFTSGTFIGERISAQKAAFKMLMKLTTALGLTAANLLGEMFYQSREKLTMLLTEILQLLR